MEERKFHLRGFTSMLAGFSLLVMALSGIMLYLGPHGGTAFWIGWSFLGLGMKSWADAHVISGLLFILAGACHLYLNWGALMSYVYSRARRTMALRRELAAAFGLAAVFTLGSISSIPPFANILELGEHLRESWVERENRPPFPHAERLSLKELCRSRGIDLSLAKEELKRKGLDVDSADNIPIGRIAKMSGLAPVEIYSPIRKLETVHFGREADRRAGPGPSEEH